MSACEGNKSARKARGNLALKWVRCVRDLGLIPVKPVCCFTAAGCLVSLAVWWHGWLMQTAKLQHVCNGWSDKLFGIRVFTHDDMFPYKRSCFSFFCPGSLTPVSVLKQYVVSIDGNDALIKWQLEKGLDWTISSVAGESYRVDVSWTSLRVYVLFSLFQELLFRCLMTFQIDLSEALMSCVGNIITDKEVKVRSVRIHALFTLKYCSDALFDFPHWFGFSKRQFNVTVSNSS